MCFGVCYNKKWMFDRLSVEMQQWKWLCGEVLILFHSTMWHTRTWSLLRNLQVSGLLWCVLGIEVAPCNTEQHSSEAHNERSGGSVCLMLLFIIKERMSCSRWCYSSYTLGDSQRYLNIEILTFMNIWSIFFLTLPVQMAVLCLKVSSAGYYWCQGCNTLQREADHTMKSLGKRAQRRYYLWGLVPCMKFCCILFCYSGRSA